MGEPVAAHSPNANAPSPILWREGSTNWWQTHSLLTGEAALPSTIAAARAILEGDTRVDAVCEVLSMQLGPDEILMAATLDFNNDLTGPELEQAADELTDKLQWADPRITRVFIRPGRVLASPSRIVPGLMRPPERPLPFAWRQIGYVPLSRAGAELLFETFSQRYERGSTIITSNLPFEDWTSVLGSERLTGALLDRLTHHVSILTMNGDSYRLKQSAGRRRAPATADQNQAPSEIVDPDTGEITTS
jgi:hypothetical protein